jgi:hypothetical protein
MIVLGGWPGRIVLGTGRFGVRPDEFANLGDFNSPLDACVDPGDENTEFAWVIGSLPASGTLDGNDDGAMRHTGAADGTYTIPFNLYTWAPGGPGVDEGSTSFETTFGAGVAADLALAYNVRAAVSVDRSLAYNIIVAVLADRSLAYTVRAAASADLALVYNLEGASGVAIADRPLAYAVRSAVESGRSLTYGVRAAVESDLALAYSVRAAVSADLALAFNVEAATGGAGAAAVWQRVIEDGLSAEEILRVILAAVSGRTTGLGTNTETYLSRDGTRSRLVIDFDGQNNRTSVTLDAAP